MSRLPWCLSNKVSERPHDHTEVMIKCPRRSDSADYAGALTNDWLDFGARRYGAKLASCSQAVNIGQRQFCDDSGAVW